MERVMAPTSQQLLQGGMRSRDWFSDKLEGDTSVKAKIRQILKRKCLEMVNALSSYNGGFKGLFSLNSPGKT